MRHHRTRPTLVAAVLAGVLLASTGCSGSGAADNALVLYNAQNSRLMESLVQEFTAESGIAVTMRNGGGSELGSQLVKEGGTSPADVFTTENATAMALVERAGLFAPPAARGAGGSPEAVRTG